MLANGKTGSHYRISSLAQCDCKHEVAKHLDTFNCLVVVVFCISSL